MLGTLVTLQVAAGAMVWGLTMGILSALAKSSHSKILQSISTAYTSIFRGLPELLTILLIYYSAEIVLGIIANDVFGFEDPIDLNPLYTGMFALGLIFGAYASEVFRGALLAIAKGQTEVSMALGMSKLQCYQRIIIPQIWRLAIPGLGNLFLVLLKDTALVSVIGLNELMQKSKLAVGFTKEPFTFYMFAALIYLSLTIISMVALHYLEKRTNRGMAVS